VKVQQLPVASRPFGDFIVFVDESGDHNLEVITTRCATSRAVQGNGLKVFP